MHNVLDLTQQLIACESITPIDAGCQTLIADQLRALDFNIEFMPCEDVSNLYARRGAEGPLLVFLGHTDVVPTGPCTDWHSDPFVPNIRDGMLYGRGAADMKGSVAAMVIACATFFKQHTTCKGSVALLLTSDEEGQAIDGTRKVIERLQARGERIDYCIVGEPSCHTTFGDTIKVGRRGTLSAILTIHGIQGHIAYPQLAENPIHRFAPALTNLCNTIWDAGNADFPPTSFQISNIHAGTGANNVIPGSLEVQFNFRFSSAITADELKQQIHNILDQQQLRYDIVWHLGGEAFLTKDGKLRQVAQQAVHEITGVAPQYSTSGGTSDGRFVAPTGSEIIEFGPCNSTIHKINECVSIAELDSLVKVYTRMMELLIL